MTDPNPVRSMGMQLIADLADAGNLAPAVQTADPMLAADLVPPHFTRGTLVACSWHEGLRHEAASEEGLTKYANRELRLLSEGCCAEHDMQAGI